MRLVPSRQPVERSCCMSPPSLHAISRMRRAQQADARVSQPSAARMNTVSTNALEIGLLSEMPSEMPFTSTNRKQRPTATRGRTPVGQTWLPRTTPGAPEHDPQDQAQTLTRFQSSAGLRLGAPLPEAPDGLDEDQRQVHDRRAEDGAERDDEADLPERLPFLQPADADQVRRLPQPIRPTTMAGMAMRAPTIIPAPKVDVEMPRA